MSNSAVEQAHRINRVISKDKQLITNFEGAFLSDLMRVAEVYSYVDRNHAKLHVSENVFGTCVKFETIIKGWKPVNYIK